MKTGPSAGTRSWAHHADAASYPTFHWPLITCLSRNNCPFQHRRHRGHRKVATSVLRPLARANRRVAGGQMGTRAHHGARAVAEIWPTHQKEAFMGSSSTNPLHLIGFGGYNYTWIQGYSSSSIFNSYEADSLGI